MFSLPLKPIISIDVQQEDIFCCGKPVNINHIPNANYQRTNGKRTEMSRGFEYSTAHMHLFTNYFC